MGGRAAHDSLRGVRICVDCACVGLDLAGCRSAPGPSRHLAIVAVGPDPPLRLRRCMVVEIVTATEAQSVGPTRDRHQWLTRSLQPTAAVPFAFDACRRFGAPRLRRGLVPRRLRLREVVSVFAMAQDSDWRLQGQERQLQGAVLLHRRYHRRSPTSDHDHCEFCWAKFMEEN